MGKLKDIIHTNQEVFDKIANGTHPTETYSNDNLYCVDLGDPIVLGAEGSKTHINENNELIVDALNENEVQTMINNALNAIGVAEERSY